jgi:voltage-gated potassium channel
MGSSHDKARIGRVGSMELVLTGKRLPRFGLLLTLMLADLTLAPFIAMLPRGAVLVQSLTVLVLFAALAVAGLRRIAVVLFAGAALLHIGSSVLGGPFLAVASPAFRLVFLAYVLALIVGRVLADRIVTLDTIAGAASAYVLLGAVWGNLLLVVERLQPGSFDVPMAWTQGPGHTLTTALMYFSYATLTTVGYGYIHPNNAAAGSLCAAEALVGQLYLAIMIARMVGLHTSVGTAHDRDAPGDGP